MSSLWLLLLPVNSIYIQYYISGGENQIYIAGKVFILVDYFIVQNKTFSSLNKKNCPRNDTVPKKQPVPK